MSLNHRYTLGRGASLDNVKFDMNTLSSSKFEIHRVERGGEVTYHCPGQLVCYPVLNLNYYKRDLHWYVRSIEEVVIRLLNDYNLKGERIKG